MPPLAAITADIITKTYDPSKEYTKLYYTDPETAMGYRFGTISDINDPEGLGRVKVHLPSINEKAISDWAPIIRSYSSDESGMWHLPRVEDRVYCGFINNKPEMPVVLGFLYTNESKPPVEQDDENNKKVIISPAGTRIELFDKTGEERISIVSKNESMILQIDDNSGILIKNEEGDIDICCKEFTCGGSGTGSLEFSEELSIEVEKKITIETKSTLACKAKKEALLKSSKNIKLIGTGGVTAGMKQMAAKNDRVLGLDIHKEVVPIGSGTIDVPFPNPFIAKLVDKLSENVYIGDREAAVKGSIAKNDPPHILFPPGIKFCENPKNEGEVKKDTVKDVLINGKEAAVLLSKVKECSDMSFPFIGEGLVITPGVPMLSILRNILLNVKWALLEGILASAGVALGAVLNMICEMLGSGLEELLSSVTGELPDISITQLKWIKDGGEISQAMVDDEVILQANVSGIDDGEIIDIIIYEKDSIGSDDKVAALTAVISDGKIEKPWKVVYKEDEDDIESAEELGASGYTLPEYIFECKKSLYTVTSGLLEVVDWVHFTFLHEGTDEPLAGAKYIITLEDGSKREGLLDADGYGKETEIPPGRFSITIYDDENEYEILE